MVRETWKTWYMVPETTGIVLSSPSIDEAKLGDVCAFCLALMPVFHQSLLFGLGLLLAREVGNWLEKHITGLVAWTSSSNDPIPLLQGLSRARKLDPRLMVQAVITAAQAGKSKANDNGSVDRHGSRAFCYIYGQLVASSVSSAGSLTKTILADGCRNFGETMDLYFSYSPLLNIGAWLPFQVPLSLVLVVAALALMRCAQA